MVVLMPSDLVFAERARHPRDRVGARSTPGDELRDHRIVEDRHRESGQHAAIVTNAGAAGRMNRPHQPRRRHEPFVRILGVDAAFDRVALRRERTLGIDASAARRARCGSASARDRRWSPSRSPGARPGAACSSRGSRTSRPRRAGTRSCRRCCSRRPPRPCRRVGRSAAAACGSTAIDGDSSTTFWWRRWMEHSRSTNGTTVPYWSASS